MLLILDAASKIKTIKDIDNTISAEIPDPETCPLLYDTVTSSMIHGPCGAQHPTAPCMATKVVDGREVLYCTKNYPRPLVEKTVLNNKSYPQYQRRANGRTFRKNNFTADSSWVVPYNPYLTTKYNAHINVEVCSSLAAVKYLYKYVYKGHDRTRIALHPAVARHRARRGPKDINEVDDFQDARYVSSCEALWRIFQFKLHGRSPSMQRLPVHLEDHQTVVFDDDDNLQDVVDAQRDSCLMAYFKLNQNDPGARNYTYSQIPLHYTWQNHTWRRRTRARSVMTRLYFVHPKDRERHALRLLLLDVKGATSFQDLRTVPNRNDNTRQIVYDTFREAALVRKLLDSDKEWFELLQEAIVDQMPTRLRHLFAWILCHCAPANPLTLWQQFSGDLSQDYLYRLHLANPVQDAPLPPAPVDAPLSPPPDDPPLDPDTIRSRNAALADINKILIGMDENCSLDKFPELYRLFTGDNINEHFDDLNDIHLPPPPNNHALFNPGQRAAFDRIVDAIEGRPTPKKIFFIDGPAGTGKSFLYNTLIAHVLGQDRTIITVASSGIAALILHEGRTAHSTFKIPLKVSETSTCNIPVHEDLAARIRDAAAIIWDEAPMTHRHTFETVDRSLRDVMRVASPLAAHLPFGGKVVIFGGDFRQVTPVVQRATQRQIEDASLRFSKFWPHIESLKLIENMRVAQDPQNEEFIQFLLRIGEGREPTVTSGQHNDYIKIPTQFVFQPVPPNPNDGPEKQLIRTIYPGLDTAAPTPQVMADRVLLTCLNADVDRMNALATEMMPGESVIYNAIDCIPDEDSADAGIYTPEFLNTLSLNGMPPFKLELKVGQPIILLRNIHPAQGLCNGTRLIVRQLGRNLIGAEIMTGINHGHVVIIPRIPLTNADDDLAFPIKFRRTQFPIKPAYAMTINKAQGQTLQQVGLYLPQPVFGHGQLYVALSRCTSPQNLKILIENGDITGKEGVYTRNVVFKRILEE